MPNSHVQTWPRWAIFALLFLASAVLWGMSINFVTGTWLFPATLVPREERISLTYAGEPVITTIENVGLQQDTKPPRRLNGEELPRDTPLDEERSLVPPGPPRGFWDGPRGWVHDRMAYLEQPFYGETGLPNSYYLVTDGSDVGRGYIACFNKLSKHSAGSIARKGLAPGTPPFDDQFVLGQLSNRCTTVTVPAGGPRHSFFFDEDRLVSVNLATQRVTTLGTFRGAKALSITAVVDPATAERIAAGDEKDPIERMPRVLVWSDDGVSLVDPLAAAPATAGEAAPGRVDFELPADVPINSWIEVYALTDEKIAVIYRLDPRSFAKCRVAVLAPHSATDGVAESVHDVELPANVQAPPLERAAALVSGMIPIPALGALLVSLAPLGAISAGEAKTYLEGLQFVLTHFGAPFSVVLVVSFALAWYVFRYERGQRRASARWLATLVFVLGLPGFLAWLATRRRSPMGRCAACGKSVPQDRELCAACGAERARPRVTGVEVFA